MAGYSVTYTVVDNATKNIDAINRRIAAMRAPMDRLSKQVSRFVDVSGLGTVAKGFASIGRAASGVLRTLVEIVPVLGTITGAATIAGMAKLVGSYADWAQQLTLTADNLGMTTQQLQQFEDATRLAGGKTSDMDAALGALYKTQSDFFRGQASADQIGWLNKLGISLKDATGHARSMADLLPEVVKKIGELPVPADRAAASAALLGDANDTLVETFRRSHQSFNQWLTDASRYTDLSEKQKDQLQAFSEAQGRIGTAFDHLGQQIAATLAKDFTPLINQLSAFVEKHTPEIVAAVDRISSEFAAWLEGIDWSKVEAGIGSLIESLKWVSTHLDTIKDVAEAIAVVFATKWAVGIVASIAQVVTALGVEGGIAGGIGLLGPLGAVAALLLVIIDHWKDLGQAASEIMDGMGKTIDRLKQNLSDFWSGKPGDRSGNPYGSAPSAPLGGAWAPPKTPQAPLGGAWKGAAPVEGVTGLAATPFGALIARGEGDYSSVNRGAAGGYAAGKEDLASKTVAEVMADQAAQKYNAAGRYQIIGSTLKSAVAAMKLKGDEKFDQKLQDRIFGEYLAGAKRPEIADYISGRSNDLKAAQLATSEEWASVADPNTGQSHYAGQGNNRASISSAEIADALQRSRAQVAQAGRPATQVAQGGGPSAAVPPPSPANGSVDVNIVGKNLPPNTAITASASGAGVNAPPPRVEHQAMESI